MRPELWRAHSQEQVYITSLLTEILGHGPAAVAASDIPDLHHFRGSFGAKHVIPLWRDPSAHEPNVTTGLLEKLNTVHGATVSPDLLFAYAYGILAQPAYVERFWDELEQPPPHLPVTKDPELFQRVADHGARLLYLHTYGARFASAGDDGTVPQGDARCTAGVSSNTLPNDFKYDPATEILTVGEGKFAPVTREVWEYSVSGYQVVKSWLDRRKSKRSGRRSSALDDIRPERWEFTEDLLNLLWVLEATLHLQAEGADLLNEVCASDLFHSVELPRPSNAEREPPTNISPNGGQGELLAAE